MSAYQSFAVTVTGGSHIKHGKVCQDASFRGESAGAVIAVVADGHGDDNCFRSDRGSQFAAECTAKGIAEFAEIHEAKFSAGIGIFRKKIVPPKSDFDKAFRDLVKHIVASWQVKAEEDYTANPFTPQELALADEKHRKKFEAGNGLYKAYGATLIAAAITDDYWLGIHIGDGRFTALYPDGSYDQPVPWDEKCYLNVTTSICDDDAFESARCYSSYNMEKPPPVAVFLCTDGIDDNYPVDENEKHLFKLYRTIAIAFAEDGFASTCGNDGMSGQLKELANQFATKGKGDDTSIAGFIDMEALKSVVPIWKKQIADEEAKAVEEAKAAAEKAAREEQEAAQKAAAKAAAQRAAVERAAKEEQEAAQKAAAKAAAEKAAAQAKAAAEAKAAAQTKAAKEAAQKAAVEKKPETGKPKTDIIRDAQEAIAAYKKQMGRFGDFVTRDSVPENEKR
jgi:serine/threonine protein phosphatase PrpC